jgi:hypothetical protein
MGPKFRRQFLGILGELRFKAAAQLLVCRKLAKPFINVG